MSWVWNVVLSFSNEEFWEGDEYSENCPPLDAINAWIPNGKLVDLTKPTFKAGAGSGMEANLYGGGFKHFDIEEFFTVVDAQPWKDRKNVLLLLQGEEDDIFRSYKLSRRRVTPPRSKRQRTT